MILVLETQMLMTSNKMNDLIKFENCLEWKFNKELIPLYNMVYGS